MYRFKFANLESFGTRGEGKEASEVAQTNFLPTLSPLPSPSLRSPRLQPLPLSPFLASLSTPISLSIFKFSGSCRMAGLVVHKPPSKTSPAVFSEATAERAIEGRAQHLPPFLPRPTHHVQIHPLASFIAPSLDINPRRGLEIETRRRRSSPGTHRARSLPPSSSSPSCLLLPANRSEKPLLSWISVLSQLKAPHICRQDPPARRVSSSFLLSPFCLRVPSLRTASLFEPAAYDSSSTLFIFRFPTSPPLLLLFTPHGHHLSAQSSRRFAGCVLSRSSSFTRSSRSSSSSFEPTELKLMRLPTSESN